MENYLYFDDLERLNSAVTGFADCEGEIIANEFNRFCEEEFEIEYVEDSIWRFLDFERAKVLLNKWNIQLPSWNIQLPSKTQEQEVYYAKVVWAVEDIQELQPGWSLSECKTWLIANEKHIEDRLVEHGWEVIKELMWQDRF